MVKLLSSLCLAGALGLLNRPSEPRADFPPIPPAGKHTYALANSAGFLEFDWNVVDTGETVRFIGPRELDCRNRCRGQIHVAHVQCDLSCDAKCEQIHQTTIRPHIGGLLGAAYLLGGTLDRAAARFGTSFDGTAVANNINQMWANNSFEDDRYSIPFSSGCWNETPCSTSYRTFPARRFHVTLNWQLYRFEKRPNGTEARVQGPRGQETDTLWVPVGPPGPGKAVIRCSCDVVSRDGDGNPIPLDPPPINTMTPPAGTATPPPAPGKPKEFGLVIPNRTGLGLGYVGALASTGRIIDKTFLESVGFQVTCPSLSSCEITATNKTNQPIRFTLLPGVVFACIPGGGDGAQDTILVKELKFNLPAMGQMTKTVELAGIDARPLLALIGSGRTDPNSATPLSLEGRVLCLDFEKRPPTIEDKFGIAAPNDEALMLIARRTASQPMQGGWDQARIWVAKDAIPLAKVDERLNPPIGAPFYVRVMQEAAEWGGIDFTNPKYRPCLEAKHALAIEAGPKPMLWFGETIGRVDGAALASFVRSSLPAFAAKFSDATAQDHVDRIVALASGMIASGHTDAAAAAMELLQKGTPEPGLARFASNRNLSELNSLLMRTDSPELAASALQTVEVLKLKKAQLACLNMNPKLPKELRARAAQIASGL